VYNKAILIGRLVADPELRTTPNGISVVTFRIAVDRAFQKGGEKKADFINITAWRQQAEFVSRYFSKGRPIGVDGAIQTRDYTDKEGNKRTAFEVVADRVFFVESKSASAGSPAPVPGTAAADPSLSGVSYASGSTGDFEIVDDDDLPF
jgi:single-strand DNA-binding protein